MKVYCEPLCAHDIRLCFVHTHPTDLDDTCSWENENENDSVNTMASASPKLGGSGAGYLKGFDKYLETCGFDGNSLPPKWSPPKREVLNDGGSQSKLRQSSKSAHMMTTLFLPDNTLWLHGKRDSVWFQKIQWFQSLENDENIQFTFFQLVFHNVKCVWTHHAYIDAV